jgi:hypothetical protein
VRAESDAWAWAAPEGLVRAGANSSQSLLPLPFHLFHSPILTTHLEDECGVGDTAGGGVAEGVRKAGGGVGVSIRAAAWFIDALGLCAALRIDGEVPGVVELGGTDGVVRGQNCGQQQNGRLQVARRNGVLYVRDYGLPWQPLAPSVRVLACRHCCLTVVRSTGRRERVLPPTMVCLGILLWLARS